MSQTQELRTWLRQLRELVPALLPVKVRCVPLDVCGRSRLLYQKVNGQELPVYFAIDIKQGMTSQETFDTLLHEWAHVLAWQQGHQTLCDHDPIWGLAMSMVYQEMVEP